MIKSQIAQARWILAFDASCATCREISDAVSRACGGSLEALSLVHADVVRWREQSLGADVPSAPILMRVEGDDVRAWTGTAMALPLARRLGLRTSARVLRALGHLRNQATAVPFERPGVMDRAGFLQLGAGLAVAAGIVVAGATPAFAEKKCATAAAWVTKNKERLPRTYDELIEYPTAYRRAIFAALPATTKSMLWAEQLTRHQAANQLSPEQTAVIRTGLRLLRPALYEQQGSAEAKRGLQGLMETAASAFGPKTARALFGTLGPADPAQYSSRELPDNSCTCSSSSNLCENDTYCQSGFCGSSSWGCGAGWFFSCDGLCIQ